MATNDQTNSMKVVVFYEGKTEEKMLLWFFRHHCSIDTTQNQVEFKERSEGNIALLFYCEGHQNVISNAVKYKHFYKNNEQVVLIRDLEEIPCYQGLKIEVTKNCPDIVAKGGKSNLFAKPQFEEVYFADESLLKKAIEEHLESNLSKNPLTLDENISQLDRNKPNESLKTLFKTYDSPFHKTNFANYFFSQFDFVNSDHPYFNRLKLIFQKSTFQI